MNTKFEKENLIKNFLLEEMSEDERLNFEEDFLLDENLFEQVRVVEDELIEKYARGWMNPAERSKFEKNFLTTAKRRERVEFAKKLLAKVDKERFAESAAIVSTAETVTFWERIAALFRTPQFAVGGALALLFMLLGGMFLFQSVNNEGDNIVKQITPTPEVLPTQTPSERHTATPEISNTNEVVEDNSNVEPTPTPRKQNINKPPIKKKTPKPIIQKTPKPETKKTPTPKVKAPSPILALFSGTVRSGGNTKQVNLPKNAKSLRLQLNLKNVDYKLYTAQITDADGKVLYKSGKLKPRKSRLFLSILAKKLKRGDYLVNLSGINSQGESESVAEFQFRVNRK